MFPALLDVVDAAVELTNELINEQKKKQGRASAFLEQKSHSTDSIDTSNASLQVSEDSAYPAGAIDLKPDTGASIERIKPKQSLNRRNLRQAMIHKEILDKPLCLR